MKKKDRPQILLGKTTKILTGYGTLYITMNELDGKLVEIFVTVSKSGASVMAKAEAIGRLCSLSLRKGATVEEIIDQLKDISGENPIPYKNGNIKSIPDAVAKILTEHYQKEEG